MAAVGFAYRPVLGSFQLRGVPARPVFCERLKYGRFPASEQNLPLHVPRERENSVATQFRPILLMVRRYVRAFVFRMARNLRKTNEELKYYQYQPNHHHDALNRNRLRHSNSQNGLIRRGGMGLRMARHPADPTSHPRGADGARLRFRRGETVRNRTAMNHQPPRLARGDKEGRYSSRAPDGRSSNQGVGTRSRLIRKGAPSRLHRRRGVLNHPKRLRGTHRANPAGIRRGINRA